MTAATVLRRLTASGLTVEPRGALLVCQPRRLVTPELADLIRERCTVGPGRSVQAHTLFDAWTAWCEAQGRDHSGTVQTFGRDLRAAVPRLKTTQPRDGGNASRPRTYEGICLG